MAAIELKSIRAGYGGAEKLHGISAKFNAGEVAVIAGPNGCGKSTLLKAAAGILPITSGDVLINGDNIKALAPKALAQSVAFLPQARSIPSLSVERLVLHGRFPYLGYPRRYSKSDFEIVKAALQEVGLSALAKKDMSALSGGERQKAYIAMALAQSTDCILMDEPTTYLDIDFQLALWQTAKQLAARGKAVVIVTHDITQALRYADNLLVIKDGNAVAAGSPESVYQSGALNSVFNVKIAKAGGHYVLE